MKFSKRLRRPPRPTPLAGELRGGVEKEHYPFPIDPAGLGFEFEFPEVPRYRVKLQQIR